MEEQFGLTKEELKELLKILAKHTDLYHSLKTALINPKLSKKDSKRLYELISKLNYE